jgi:hypothetical protein
MVEPPERTIFWNGCKSMHGNRHTGVRANSNLEQPTARVNRAIQNSRVDNFRQRCQEVTGKDLRIEEDLGAQEPVPEKTVIGAI